MKTSEYPLTTVLPGRASAFQTAEIRPRVTGIIREIPFKEGSEVKQGDVLYQIEDNTYMAEVAQAKASVAKAEASVPSAEANLARYERLVNSGATQIEYENAKVTLLQAQAGQPYELALIDRDMPGMDDLVIRVTVRLSADGQIIGTPRLQDTQNDPTWRGWHPTAGWPSCSP